MVATATTAVIAAIVLAAAWVDAAGTTTFVVRDTATGDVLYARDLDVGERFRLEHTHSVTRRPIVETFSIADRTTLAVEELWFDEFGANLPTGPEDVDGERTTFLWEDNGMRVVHHGRLITHVPVIVGSNDVDHVLIFSDGDRVHLLDIADPWRQVELAVGAAAPRSR